MPGFDAALMLWDAGRAVTPTSSLIQHGIDYTPYEGLIVTGWPARTIARGCIVMADGVVTAETGQGVFLPLSLSPAALPRGLVPNGFDAALAGAR